MGNAFIQALAQSQCGQEGVDPDADSDELPSEPELLEFMQQRFTIQDFVPSTGMGHFDARYDPTSGRLDILLRLGVVFEDSAGGTWADQDKAEWISKLETSVESQWATQEVIHCGRPGWCVQARPALNLHVTEGGDGHYAVTVRRSEKRGSDFRPGVSERSGLFGTTRRATLEEDHIDVGLDDEGVVQTEIERVEALTEPPILFETTRDAVAYAPGQEGRVVRMASDMLALPPGTPRLSVTAAGWESQEGDDSTMQAAKVVTEQMPQGSPHRWDYSTWGGSEQGHGEVRFYVNMSKDAIEYEDRFQYASHEIGHMLGLPDDYADEGDSDHDAMVAAHDVLIESAGAQQLIKDADTSSIMSKGGDVLQGHLVTMWEALTVMTRDYLSPAEWQF